MSEFDPEVFAAAKALNRADSGGVGTYEWNNYENGDRTPDTMRHVRQYIGRAEAALKAANSIKQ
jgi:hypothetical protein